MWRPFSQWVAGWLWIGERLHLGLQPCECRAPGRQFLLLGEDNFIQRIEIPLQLHPVNFELGDSAQ